MDESEAWTQALSEAIEKCVCCGLRRSLSAGTRATGLCAPCYSAFCDHYPGHCQRPYPSKRELDDTKESIINSLRRGNG